MKTYWNVSVYIDDRVAVSTGDVTLSCALAQGISHCVYYQTVYPSGSISIRDISESCSRCHNSGEIVIRRPRSCRTVRCPECKGKLATGKLDDIKFKMPDNANRIRLVMDEGDAA